MEIYFLLWGKNNSKAVTRQTRKKSLNSNQKHTQQQVLFSQKSQLTPWDYAEQFALICPCGCPACTFSKVTCNDNQIYQPVLYPHKCISVVNRKERDALLKKKEKKKKPCKIKLVLSNPFSSSLFNLVWWFTKSLSNFWKAMLNTTSKFLETFTHGLVGARQKWCHTCLFTFHDLPSLLVSLLLNYLPIFLASTTENISSSLFANAWPCSKPCFITHEGRRGGGRHWYLHCAFHYPLWAPESSFRPC